MASPSAPTSPSCDPVPVQAESVTKNANGRKRKRTRSACLRCRARRVRCDLSDNNTPCTNCRLDEVDCPVAVGGRKPRSTSTVQEPTRADGQVDSATITKPNNRRRAPSLTGNLDPAQAPIKRLYSEGLPTFLRPPASSMSPHIVRLLREKCALSVPSKNLQKALWLAYLRSVHPSMPILDPRTVSSLIGPSEPTESMFSLLLFQAIMFAGMYFVDMDYLLEAGYVSRKKCLHDCFEIVKLLYDMDYEQDRVCLIQSLLIMTLWYRSPDDHKDPWHYVGLAVALAKKTGLHQEARMLDHPPAHRPLLRRLWWCCVMRDYMIAYGMSRPVHLHICESNMKMLTMDDFEGQDIAAGVSMAIDSPGPNFSHEGQSLAIVFVELIKLCRIAHIYVELRDLRELEPADSNEQIAALEVGMPRLPSEQHTLEKVDADLSRWYSDISRNPITKLSALQDSKRTDTSFVQHCSLLHMLYHAAVITVHRKHLMPVPRATTTTDSYREAARSRDKVRAAAREVTSICEMLQARKLLRGLPMPFMSCLLITTIVQLLEIKFAGDSPRPENLKALTMLSGIMRHIATEVTYIDWSYKVLESACQTAKIDMSSSDTIHVLSTSSSKFYSQRAESAPVTPEDSNLRTAEGDQLRVEFTPLPPFGDETAEPTHPLISGFGSAFGLPSPFEDDGFLDIDFSLMQDSSNDEWASLLDAAGRGLTTGYGDTPNAQFLDFNMPEVHTPSMQTLFEAQGDEYEAYVTEDTVLHQDPTVIAGAESINPSLLF